MSTYMKIAEELQEAWETSTVNHNRFGEIVNAMPWDDRFDADGELYFLLGECCFTTPSLDPFDCDWSPELSYYSDQDEANVVCTIGDYQVSEF